jgi:hypothetical protein
METAVQTLHSFCPGRRPVVAMIAMGWLMFGFAQAGWAQTGTNPLNIFKNYFVTGDYVVAGWVEAAPDGSGFAPGSISIPDTTQPSQAAVPATVPVGADIVGAYLYWATVEKSKTAFAGQQAFFNGYAITGTILGNPNAPVSWSSGGCAGSSNGTTTMRTYRADVRPYLPIDLDPSSPTFGALIARPVPPATQLTIPVRLADSGSNGNTPPNSLGATLVVIYRVLNPAVALNAIVLYDGAYAPSNTAQNTSQTMIGFYQPATSPVAKLTHIVGNGQKNKSEQVFLNNTSQPLPSLYTPLPPFPGIYGTWDNPTWVLTQFPSYVSNTDTFETTLIQPSASNSGCVSWGAMVLSTTVQDTDGDGLLDVWEQGPTPGYTDAVSGQFVPLPGASPFVKDLFVELDYLSNLDGSAGPFLHSHLPKQAALHAVGTAFFNQGINVHFDLGTNSLGLNIYPTEPYVIQYPVSIPNKLPTGTLPPQAGSGGNVISEGSVVCNDNGKTPPFCAFPGQPAIGWKGDFLFVRDTGPNSSPPAPLGNFQPGRAQSYHYVLFGHSLGSPRSFWSTFGAALADPTFPQLISIVNTVTNLSTNSGTATVTIQSPAGTLNPGDCLVAPVPAACSDLNSLRVTIAGALTAPFVPGTSQQPASPLNGTYVFTILTSGTTNNITTTTFTIPTTNVPNGAFQFSCQNPAATPCFPEPQLGVAYLGPTSTSGHSDFGGGGDSAVTFGLWRADDPVDPITLKPSCQPDPSQPLGTSPAYCNDEVGSAAVQTGTLLHELGHSLTLTHGGTYYVDTSNPSLASYELNCKPNFLSAMNYLFQVRGFVEGGFDYSGQLLPPLNETSKATAGSPSIPALSEVLGIGNDPISGPATHLTRWYSIPNALDRQLGRFALTHCDGTPLAPGEAAAVRVDGFVTQGGTFSAPLDWNNNLLVPDDPIASPGVDVNYNGFTGDSPFSGFSDWQVLNPSPTGGVALQQMSARAGAFGFSEGGGVKSGSGGVKSGSGGIDDEGGGVKSGSGGVKSGSGGVKSGSGGVKSGSGGVDQDEDTATSTVDPPTNLTCSPPTGPSPCVPTTGTVVDNSKSVPLTWTPPSFGQIRRYDVWRAVGSFPTLQSVFANHQQFTDIKTLKGAPPATSFTDVNVKNNTTYTYFVTDQNKQGAQSGPSTPLVVTIKF